MEVLFAVVFVYSFFLLVRDGVRFGFGFFYVCDFMYEGYVLNIILVCVFRIVRLFRLIF